MTLSNFSPVLRFIEKPVIFFALQIKWLVSIWNATLGWNELDGLDPEKTFSTVTMIKLQIIQEWTKQNLRKTAFKTEVVWSAWSA